MRHNLIIYFFLGFVFPQLAFSQEKFNDPNGNLQVFKFSNYSVEADKLIQQEFKNDNANKIIFTCIPAGILVIESKSEATSQKNESVSQRFEKVSKSLNFLQLQGLTLKDAEEKCSQSRSAN